MLLSFLRSRTKYKIVLFPPVEFLLASISCDEPIGARLFDARERLLCPRQISSESNVLGTSILAIHQSLIEWESTDSSLRRNFLGSLACRWP